jgi:hypothetical protein
MDDNEMYHSDLTRIGKSGLDLINKCPALYWAKYLDPNREREKKTKALELGSAAHLLLLEPEKFPNEYVILPSFAGTGSRSRKDDFLLENEGKNLLTIEEYNQIRRMRDSVMKHPIVSSLLENGVAEQRIDWIDPFTGALCKAKPDWFDQNQRFIVDLKTTEDASEHGFGKSAFNYRYHVQAPFYFDGAVQNGMNPQGFVFVAVEKKPPFLVNVFVVDHEVMQHGRAEYHRDLETYLECVRTDLWPGYGDEAKTLRLPSWATKQ